MSTLIDIYIIYYVAYVYYEIFMLYSMMMGCICSNHNKFLFCSVLFCSVLYPCSGIRPSSIVVHPSSTSSLKSIYQSKPNFTWSLHGERGANVCINGPGNIILTCQRWLQRPYIVKTLKIFFSRTKRPMILKLGMKD